MTDEEKHAAQAKLHAELHATLGALEGVVNQHGAEAVGTAIQALCMKNVEVMRALQRAAKIVIEDMLKDRFKDLADTCQCPECRAQRGQA